MKVNISLSNRGPSLWMLGRPKHILVRLTDKHPGPTEVEFDHLDHDLQKQILLGLKAQNITTDVSFDELLAIWTRSKTVPVTTPAMTDAIKAHLKAQQEQLEQEAKLKRENKLRDAQEKLDERCKYILTKSVKAVKSSVAKETNLYFIRRLLQFEQEGKNRKNVTEYIQQKIDKILDQQEKKATQSIDLPFPTTNLSPVVESKEGKIAITPEMLIQSTLKK